MSKRLNSLFFSCAPAACCAQSVRFFPVVYVLPRCSRPLLALQGLLQTKLILLFLLCLCCCCCLLLLAAAAAAAASAAAASAAAAACCLCENIRYYRGRPWLCGKGARALTWTLTSTESASATTRARATATTSAEGTFRTPHTKSVRVDGSRMNDSYRFCCEIGGATNHC